MKRPTSVPIFKTPEEEAEYWDKHRKAKLVYKPKPKKAVIHVKVGEGLKEKIERVAKAKEISVSSLIRMVIVEKLRQLPTSG